MKFVAGAVLLAIAGIGAFRAGFGRPSCPADFEVRVLGTPADAPPVSGSCVVTEGTPTFHPTFPLLPGVVYSVRAGGREIDRIGLKRSTPAPSVTARVYPTTHVLPANQLKFYVEFSAPMTLGESHLRMRLLDDRGTEVPNAFLNLDEEMWDADRRRLTVLFEPGRVKRGLKANLQVGSPLNAGGSYTLVVDRDWPDAHGAPMVGGVTKRFTVAAADRYIPAADRWVVVPPGAGTRTPLVLLFREPMDYVVALNAVRVVDDRGQRVTGAAVLAEGEREWRFTPLADWTSEPYTLVIDSRIEDLAGNNLARLFDVDLKTAPNGRSDLLRLRFTPRVHSSRRTTMGSTRVARLAGM